MLIVDTDTAGDDTQALLMCALSDRCDLAAVTVCAGNVPFDQQVENAKYTLDLAGRTDVPVHEGAREPLLKEYEHAEYVHGEGGLGGELFPDTGIDSAPGFAPDVIAETARDHPGELSVLAIAPLTNLALALAREPDLPELLDELVVMGGSVHHIGNVTPAAEYNFWVDPDAARMVLDAFDVTLVDWGLTVRAAVFDDADLARFDAIDTPLGEFFREVSRTVRAFTREEQALAGPTQPDSLAAACLLYPELVEETTDCHVVVDEREGITRGYSAADTGGTEFDLAAPARTRVVERVDRAGFRDRFAATLRGDPDDV